MTSPTHDVVIVGAGIVGLAIGFRLTAAGQRVVLLERTAPGAGASSGNAGHIATEQIFPLASPSTLRQLPSLLFARNAPVSVLPAYWLRALPWLARFVRASMPSVFHRGTAALAALQQRAMAATVQLLHDAAAADLLHRRGHLIVAESAASGRRLRQYKTLLDRYRIPAQWLPVPELVSRVPDLTRQIDTALHVSGSGHVSNPLDVCRRLQQACSAGGSTFLSMEVQRIEQQGDVFELSGGGDVVRGKTIVIAAGAWSAPLVAQLGVQVPLDTERGYHATAGNWSPELDVAIASLDRMTLLTPMNCGVRITGFVELGGLGLPATPARIHRLEHHLRQLFPRLPPPECSGWLGFRPSLPDHLPVLGPVPGIPNAYVAFGHQHLGLTLAAVTADILCDLIHGRQPAVDLTPFRADRFH